MRHVAMFSSGAGSAGAAKRVADRYGTDDLVLLFADVNGEHGDNYRFLREAAEWIGGELVIIDNGGKTIWQVFDEVRFLGNSRIDPCSRVLKREPMRKWLEDNCDPENTVSYLGFDWTEAHRHDRAAGYWAPWKMESPLLWEPFVDKSQVMERLAKAGIEPPALTRMGFPHANCGGGCVKAGIKQFVSLLEKQPDTFAEWEWQEERLRKKLGNVAILRDRKGNPKGRPLSLKELRIRTQGEGKIDAGGAEEDWGACNCFTPIEGPEEVAG
jgi:hypothetical protein